MSGMNEDVVRNLVEDNRLEEALDVLAQQRSTADAATNYRSRLDRLQTKKRLEQITDEEFDVGINELVLAILESARRLDSPAAASAEQAGSAEDGRAQQTLGTTIRDNITLTASIVTIVVGLATLLVMFREPILNGLGLVEGTAIPGPDPTVEPTAALDLSPAPEQVGEQEPGVTVEATAAVNISPPPDKSGEQEAELSAGIPLAAAASAACFDSAADLTCLPEGRSLICANGLVLSVYDIEFGNVSTVRLRFSTPFSETKGLLFEEYESQPYSDDSGAYDFQVGFISPEEACLGVTVDDSDPPPTSESSGIVVELNEGKGQTIFDGVSILLREVKYLDRFSVISGSVSVPGTVTNPISNRGAGYAFTQGDYHFVITDVAPQDAGARMLVIPRDE